MSSDNGIYILKTKAEEHAATPFEYRVAHAQAIENIYWDPEKGETRQDGRFTPEIAFMYFGRAPVFSKEDLALAEARRLEDQHTILEYGISMLDHGDQEFLTFTKEELAEFERRDEELMEERRRRRDQELEAKRNEALVYLPKYGVNAFHPTAVYGYTEDPNGGRVYGQVMNPEALSEGNGDHIRFLPNGWDRK